MKPKKCQECGVLYKSKFNISLHHHFHKRNSMKPTRFYCQKCDKRFTNSKTFGFHKICHQMFTSRPHSEECADFPERLRADNEIPGNENQPDLLLIDDVQRACEDELDKHYKSMTTGMNNIISILTKEREQHSKEMELERSNHARIKDDLIKENEIMKDKLQIYIKEETTNQQVRLENSNLKSQISEMNDQLKQKTIELNLYEQLVFNHEYLKKSLDRLVEDYDELSKEKKKFAERELRFQSIIKEKDVNLNKKIKECEDTKASLENAELKLKQLDEEDKDTMSSLADVNDEDSSEESPYASEVAPQSPYASEVAPQSPDSQDVIFNESINEENLSSCRVRKRNHVNRSQLIKAAHLDDRAAEANDELNAYNVTITSIVRDYFEQNKIIKALEHIEQNEPEAYQVFRAADIDEHSLLSFSREDLKDLFDGNENFMLRRRIWKIIEKARESSSNSDQDSVDSFTPCPFPARKSPLDASSPKSSVKPTEGRIPLLPLKNCTRTSPRISSWKNSVACSSVDTSPTTSSSNKSNPCSRVENHSDQDNFHICKSPIFQIYTDSELTHATTRNTVSKELFNRLIRNTISNMKSACQRLTFTREPTIVEMEEMAKVLCRRYPCLERLNDDSQCLSEEERGRLTEAERNGLHGFLFKKLKKRHSNGLPAKRPQGKVPSRKRKKYDLPTPACLDKNDHSLCKSTA